MAGRTVTDGGVRIVCGSRQVLSGLRGYGRDCKEVKGLAEACGIPVNTFLWTLPDIALNRVKFAELLCSVHGAAGWHMRYSGCCAQNIQADESGRGTVPPVYNDFSAAYGKRRGKSWRGNGKHSGALTA